MTIGQVAKATGVSASAIRFYESSGVLPQPRRNRGIRHYDASIIDHLMVVRFFRASGVSVESLAELFSADTTARRKNRHAAVARRIGELDDMIANARKVKKRLRGLLACECNGDQKKCIIYA
jgi:DNA-binding transcriptional MerR regulator